MLDYEGYAGIVAIFIPNAQAITCTNTVGIEDSLECQPWQCEIDADSMGHDKC